MTILSHFHTNISSGNLNVHMVAGELVEGSWWVCSM